MSWTVHTEVFDGPIDLLLYLVERDGVDLLQISLAAIADSYLDYLDRLRGLHLGVAADYLLMASTLVYLKSLELLPKAPVLADEEGDPREAFVQHLVEYRRLKEAARELAESPRVGRDQFVRSPLQVGEGPLVTPVDAFGLLERYYALLQAHGAPEPVHVVGEPMPTLEEACRTVLHELDLAGGRTELGELLGRRPTRVARVLTFLGVLEMARLRWVTVEQERHLGPVALWTLLDTEPDYTRLTGQVVAEAS